MKITRKSIVGLFVAGGVLATACSSENDFPVDGDNTQILLSSKVDMQTRNTLQDEQIENNEHVGLFITKASSLSDVLYDNEDMIANGNGGFSHSPMYYPVSNENIDLYAYHPFTNGVTVNGDLSFTLPTDQTVLSNFLNSDLLFSKKPNVAKSHNKIAMVFNHKLAKLNFTIIEGDGMDLSGLSNIDVINVLPNVDMNLNTGVLASTTGSPVTVNAYGVQGVAQGETEVSGIAAIVTPQVFAANQKLFKIVVNGGTPNEVVYNYTPKAPVAIEAGKKYNIILTVNQAGIEISSSIEDWNTGDPIIGEGTME